MGTRNPNRASTIYLGGDGDWHGRVTVGYRDDGGLDRRHVQSKLKANVEAGNGASGASDSPDRFG